ncbi:MAG TPA: hypothetical protein VLS47_02790, partial [Gallionella sp.]|nr:hypothetical protein [Gallionella sp.]
MASPAVLRHAVKPSLRFAVLLLLLHLAVAVVVYATAMPLPARLALSILVFLDLSYYLARDVLLLLPDSWREISLDIQDVSIVSRDGKRLLGRVAHRTVVSPYFILLCVKPEGHRLP